MSYEGSRANRQQTIVAYLCPNWNIFSLTSLYQLLAAIYFHRPAGVAQRVGGSVSKFLNFFLLPFSFAFC